MTTLSNTKPCTGCGNPISAESIFIQASKDRPAWEFPAASHCDQCCEIAAADKLERERNQELDNQWNTIAPPIYRTSDTTRFPTRLQQAIATFDPTSTTGIGIKGPSGQCKTRAAFALMQIAHRAGHRAMATKATDIAKLSADQWDSRMDRSVPPCCISDDPHPTIGQSAQKRIRQFKTCDWLLIDDIGKEKPTDRAEVELYDILEERTSHDLPTIWTLNMSAAELSKKHSKDRSAPILRRLIEFSRVIILDEEDGE